MTTTQSSSEELDRALLDWFSRRGHIGEVRLIFTSHLQAYTDEIRILAEQQQVLVGQTKTMPPKPIYKYWQAVSLEALNTLANKWRVK